MRILGVDLGRKDVGIAINIAGLSMPLGQFHISKVLQEVISIVEREHIDIVIIGLPRFSGSKQDILNKKFFEGFKNDLLLMLDTKGLRSVRCEFIEESKTTIESIRAAIAAGISRKKRKSTHAIAACLIIERYLANSGIR